MTGQEKQLIPVLPVTIYSPKQAKWREMLKGKKEAKRAAFKLKKEKKVIMQQL